MQFALSLGLQQHRQSTVRAKRAQKTEPASLPPTAGLPVRLWSFHIASLNPHSFPTFPAPAIQLRRLLPTGFLSLRFAAECPLDWLVWVRRGLSEPLHGLSGLLGWLWRSCRFRCHSGRILSLEGLYVQFLCADACCQIRCR